jgi:DDE superfamily endonuclease
LVLVDEFAINTVMTRTYARAPRGERAVVLAPGNYGQSVSVLSALTLRGILAPMTIAGAVNREVFAL